MSVLDTSSLEWAQEASFHWGRSYKIHSPRTVHTTYTEKLQFGISNFAKSFSPLQHSKQLSSIFVFVFWVKILCGSDGKEPACNVRDSGSNPGLEDPLEKEMATHASILAWRIPRMEEPAGLWSMGSQRVRHD